MILIPGFGAAGAAITILCTEAIVTFFQLFLSRKIIIWKFFTKNILQFLLSSTIMSFIIFLFLKITLPDIIKLLLLIPAGAVLYFSILLKLKNEIVFLMINKLKTKAS
jgi:O-antigen/teichoic acid export membrane protein